MLYSCLRRTPVMPEHVKSDRIRKPSALYTRCAPPALHHHCRSREHGVTGVGTTYMV